MMLRRVDEADGDERWSLVGQQQEQRWWGHAIDHRTGEDGFWHVRLHYNVLEMLGLRHYLPASFVRREYLPVANPETIFDYGDLRRGQCVAITSDRGIPEGQRLYLTIYNRSRFPVFWSEVRSLPYRTLPAANTGSYLWRLHAMHSQETLPVWPTHLHVVVQ